MSSNIIFLDVDGPMIPGRMYYRGDVYDRDSYCFNYDPVAVGMINHLCSTYNAAVVFNSAHNVAVNEMTVNRQAIWNGILAEHIHIDYMTGFPNSVRGRLNAINDWLHRHPETRNWIAIDDEKIESWYAIRVDFNIGITIDDFFLAESLLAGMLPPGLTDN